MKTINLKITAKTKNQIENLAKVAHKAREARYYLQYLRFEVINDDLLKISAINGQILVDLEFKSQNSGFLAGETFELYSKSFLKLEKGFLSIDFDDKILVKNGDFQKVADKLESGIYPDIAKIRIKEDLPNSISFSIKELVNIAKAFDNDRITFFFNSNNCSKPVLAKSYQENDTAIVMPLNLKN